MLSVEQQGFLDINTLLPVMALMSCTGADRRNDTG